MPTITAIHLEESVDCLNLDLGSFMREGYLVRKRKQFIDRDLRPLWAERHPDLGFLDRAEAKFGVSLSKVKLDIIKIGRFSLISGPFRLFVHSVVSFVGKKRGISWI